MTRPETGEEAPSGLAPILERAASGDNAAWREVVERYGARVFAMAASRCRDPEAAEEVTQSVFATVAIKLGGGSYSERGRFEAWLFRVTMNRLRDLARRARHRPVNAGTDGFDARPAPEAGPSRGVDEQALHGLRVAMGCLSDADREVIELRHHGGLSFKQMAEVLDEPMGTLLARHHRALRKLREALERSAAGREGLAS